MHYYFSSYGLIEKLLHKYTIKMYETGLCKDFVVTPHDEHLPITYFKAMMLEKLFIYHIFYCYCHIRKHCRHQTKLCIWESTKKIEIIANITYILVQKLVLFIRNKTRICSYCLSWKFGTTISRSTNLSLHNNISVCISQINS